jgi:hypothetical protein
MQPQLASGVIADGAGMELVQWLDNCCHEVCCIERRAFRKEINDRKPSGTEKKPSALISARRSSDLLSLAILGPRPARIPMSDYSTKSRIYYQSKTAPGSEKFLAEDFFTPGASDFLRVGWRVWPGRQ